MSPRVRAGLTLVEAMTKRPMDIDSAFLEDLLQTLSLEEVEAAATVAFRFAVINRLADAYAFPIPTEDQKRRLAKVLSFMGRRVRHKVQTGEYGLDAHGVARPPELHAMTPAFEAAPTVLPPGLRSNVEAYAAGLWGAARPEVTLPEPLQGYVGRVAAFSWGLDDAAIEELRAAGYGDPEIHEITLAASLGAAMAGSEALYGALATRA